VGSGRKTMVSSKKERSPLPDFGLPPDGLRENLNSRAPGFRTAKKSFAVFLPTQGREVPKCRKEDQDGKRNAEGGTFSRKTREKEGPGGGGFGTQQSIFQQKGGGGGEKKRRGRQSKGHRKSSGPRGEVH